MSMFLFFYFNYFKQSNRMTEDETMVKQTTIDRWYFTDCSIPVQEFVPALENTFGADGFGRLTRVDYVFEHVNKKKLVVGNKVRLAFEYDECEDFQFFNSQQAAKMAMEFHNVVVEITDAKDDVFEGMDEHHRTYKWAFHAEEEDDIDVLVAPYVQMVGKYYRSNEFGPFEVPFFMDINPVNGGTLRFVNEDNKVDDNFYRLDEWGNFFTGVWG